MDLQLENVFPCGRLASEYISMFGLTPRDMSGRILDCAGGPSSFTAEMTRQGKSVVSCDPIYEFSAEEISQRIDATFPQMLALKEENKENYCWDEFGSPVQLGQMRMRAMRRFLEDYEGGKEQGRYVVGELPSLPFDAGSFDLALCSDFLFANSEQFSGEFHLASLMEMCRVAKEARVFPILAADSGELSPHLSPVMEQLRCRGYSVEVRQVKYEFQKGGNRMLCICGLSNAGE